ncbi:glycosyl transferase [Nonlabens dokdonensis]|uniref:Glycosyl transferase n=1 Tax=Nonlabens dokdonensis TaxID=328515 RepID=A0A1Z8BGB3_9FLAO|nr:glycosyltransferase [Nonlabens dokdonensis]OUS21609.1 glycosyl transferase [Nonlabens dokdonensis]
MSWLFLFIVCGYALVIILLSKELLTYPKTEINDTTKLLPFTVIINYRNEQANLPVLLSSIKNQEYNLDLIQWIFVNDHSTDGSLAILKQFKKENTDVSIFLLDRKVKSASGKKDGISQAIELSSHNHIITTDADCMLPQNWLLSYNAIYNKHPDAHFIAAPVMIDQKKSIISSLQTQEMNALQLITVGGFSYRQPFMCNGANMSFTKDAFHEVNGYEGNDHISSGDDIFLLEKLVAEDVMKCHYLKNKEAIVTTFPKDSFKDMISQRARWAQKGSETKSMLNKLVSFQVLAMSLLFILSPLFWVFEMINSPMFVGILATKLFTDVMVLFTSDRFFENVKWRFVPINFFIYPILVIIIAFLSLKRSDWQGRKINTPVSLQE